MDFFGFISLFGGLALFLYGMSVLGGSLEKASEGRLEKILERLTGSVLKGVLLGAVVTAAIQSSSAATVIVVGLVNARVMKLRQAIGVIMGANIGTTVTAHILRLSGGEGGFLLRLISPTTLAPSMAIAGILLFMLAKGDRLREVGQMLLGFGVLFAGMFQMEAAVRPLRELPAFAQLFQAMTNPILGVLVGAGVTAIIQSSSASVGILQALSSTGAITWAAAVPIILGQNIGTCVTPMLASVGASKNAKRAAFVHLSLNLLGTGVFLCGIYGVQHLIGLPFWGDVIDKGGIANFHTFFNVAVTVLFLPFVGLLERCVYLLVPQEEAEGQAPREDPVVLALDPRLLVSPGLALEQAHTAAGRMAALARENFSLARELLLSGADEEKAARLLRQEKLVDTLQDRVEAYLIQLSRRHLTEGGKAEVSRLLHMIGELERISDQAENILEDVQLLKQTGISFSPGAKREMELYSAAVTEILDAAIRAWEGNDPALARGIEPLEQVVDLAEEYLKGRHISRLRDGDCSVDAAFAFVEALSSMERIADHCSNIGVLLIDGCREGESHAYLHALHKGQDPDYVRAYRGYEEKYLAALRARTP